MAKQLIAFLKEIHPFQLLSDQILKDVLDSSILKEYEKGSTVIHQGDSENYIFIVTDGIGVNVVKNDNADEITIKTYEQGSLFGLIHAMAGGSFLYSVRAVSQLQCLLIPIDAFEKMMADNAHFSEEVARLITIRLKELYQKIGIETAVPVQSTKLHSRKKVVELMSQPVMTISGEASIVDVADQLINNRISSLIVTNNEKPFGIITKKDVLRAFVQEAKQKCTSVNKLKAKDIMTSQMVTIDSQVYHYEATYLMLKYNIKHLPVIENEKVIGMITSRNLFESFSNSALYLVKEIDQAKNMKELKKVIEKEEVVLQQMLEEHATAKEISSVISEINDRATQKTIQLAEKRMVEEGHGNPPVAYCWLSLGSEGRKEQTLQTDQDNAIIYEEVSKEKLDEVDRYFSRLAEKVVKGLVEIGFPECTGKIMATNQEWRHGIAEWKVLVEKWMNENEPEQTRRLTVLTDLRSIYGKKAFADELKESILRKKQNIFSLHRMAEDDTARNVAINRLGRFQLEKGEHQGELNLKHGGLAHLINGLRILAIKHGVEEVNSWERLEALYQKNVINENDRDQVLQALDDLMWLRLNENLNKLKTGEKPDHFINPNRLTKKDRIRLKKALMITRWFQMMVIRQNAIPGSYLRGF